MIKNYENCIFYNILLTIDNGADHLLLNLNDESILGINMELLSINKFLHYFIVNSLFNIKKLNIKLLHFIILCS